MNVRWSLLATTLLCGFAHAQTPNILLAEHLEIMGSACKFSIPVDTRNNVIGSIKEELSGGAFRLVFLISLGLKESSPKGRISFSCSSRQTNSSTYEPPQRGIGGENNKIRTLTPREIIREQDSGGRYFRHVAWEKKIGGSNWPANVAFSDYLFGDGKKSYTNFYLICHAELAVPCFEFSDEKTTRPSRKASLQILNFIREISFIKH